MHVTHICNPNYKKIEGMLCLKPVLYWSNFPQGLFSPCEVKVVFVSALFSIKGMDHACIEVYVC